MVNRISRPRPAGPRLSDRLVLPIVTALCLAPLALALWSLARGALTVNPLQQATFQTGNSTLTLLLLSLACTPAHTVFGWRTPLKLRRWLGLYTFGYALAHVSLFSLDHGLIDGAIDVSAILGTTIEKRYALVGALALLILVPLAITSTTGWQRRLGRAWKRLHRLVYAAAALGVLHWVWLVKSDYREPLLYAGALAVMFVLRIPSVKRAIVERRRRATAKASAARAT